MVGRRGSAGGEGEAQRYIEKFSLSIATIGQTRSMKYPSSLRWWPRSGYLLRLLLSIPFLSPASPFVQFSRNKRGCIRLQIYPRGYSMKLGWRRSYCRNYIFRSRSNKRQNIQFALADAKRILDQESPLRNDWQIFLIEMLAIELPRMDLY